MQFEKSMDAKRTLINLHEKFPEFDLDTLFSILDCYAENYIGTWINTTIPDYNQKIY